MLTDIQKKIALAMTFQLLVPSMTAFAAAPRCGERVDPIVFNLRAHQEAGSNYEAANPEFWGRKAYVERCHTNMNGFLISKIVVNNWQDFIRADLNPQIYVFQNAQGNLARMPISKDAPCQSPPEGFDTISTCMAGCFAAEELVMFADGYQKIGIAESQGETQLVTLAKSASLEALTFTLNPIKYFVQSMAEETNQPMVRLHLADGGSINVTTNHPLLGSDGVMRNAGSLQAGDEMIRVNGDKVPILSIERYSMESGRVYNLAPVTTDDRENILVAQGYLSGSHIYQLKGLQDLRRIIERASWSK